MSEFNLSNSSRLIIVGCGKMGEAILAGLLESHEFEPERVIAVAPRNERRAYLEETYGITCVFGAKELKTFHIGENDVCLLAVKPQILFEVIPEVVASTSAPLFISIAAGITLKQLRGALGEGKRVVRVMPNTPAMVSKGCSIISGDESNAQSELEATRRLFASFGKAFIIKEHLHNAASALSGAGPAYFALIINALTRAGITQGLKRDVAQELSVATMAGTAEMLEKLDIHPEQLIDMVTSPGGTTIAALNELEQHDLRSAFVDAVEAATDRADVLAWEQEEAEEE